MRRQERDGARCLEYLKTLKLKSSSGGRAELPGEHDQVVGKARVQGLAQRASLSALQWPLKFEGSRWVLACPEGLEPPTPSLEGWCSIQLSYGQCVRGF